MTQSILDILNDKDFQKIRTKPQYMRIEGNPLSGDEFDQSINIFEWAMTNCPIKSADKYRKACSIIGTWRHKNISEISCLLVYIDKNKETGLDDIVEEVIRIDDFFKNNP